MSNSKIPKVIFSWLIIFNIILLVSGCARWPEPGPEPGEPDYQLKITVEVKGGINTDDGIYYIGLDTDGQTGIGPGSDIGDWKGYYYYVKLDSMGCYLYPKEEGSKISLNYSISDIESKLQVTIALSDLGDPKSIDINVVTTDSDGYTTYDYLDNYFPINTVLYSTGEGISSNDLEDDEADFDLVKVTAQITIP
jgi:hypothetical protein